MATMEHPPRRETLADGRLFVGGDWRDASSGEWSETIDPTTERPTARIARAAPADMDAAIQAARDAFDTGPWASLGHEGRAKIMFRIADLLDERAHDFALRESMDMGMPYKDFIETIMPHCSGLFRFFGGQAMAAMDGAYRQSYESDLRILTRREALGVVGCITPFNFPLALSVSKFAPAFAAGNTVVHKPSEDTPLTALAFAQVCQDAGLPAGVYNLVTGPGAELGQMLSKSPLVDKIAITGSTGTGQNIIKDSADTLKHLTMELGGKSPNIILADADLDAAVKMAFFGIFWNKGEVCVAGSRLLVERPIYKEVVERLAAMAEDTKLGDPLDPETVVGPIANKREFDKVMGYVEDGKRNARLVAGGNSRQVDGAGLFIEPTVFADATNELKISREEIFGPVLPVIPFDGEDEAVHIANDTPYGLASGIQTGDLGRGLRLADRIRAGTVWLNTWHKYHPNAPFGGFKLSGYGREQGVEALENYTQWKSVWANLATPGTSAAAAN